MLGGADLRASSREKTWRIFFVEGVPGARICVSVKPGVAISASKLSTFSFIQSFARVGI